MQTAKMKYLPLGAEFKHDLHGDIVSRIVSTDPLQFAAINDDMKAVFTPNEHEQNLSVFVVKKKVECPHCKGKKEWACVARVFDGKVKGGYDAPPVMMPCDVCNKKGTIDPIKYAEDMKANDEFWCSCGNPSGNVTSYEDGEGSACFKHHYVCNDCGKVSQVG